MICEIDHSSIVGAKFCSSCGVDLEIESKKSELVQAKSKITKDKFASTSKKIWLASFILFIIFSLITFSNGSEEASSTDSSSAYSYEDTNWVPAGFNVWPSDSNVAFKWSDGECSTSYGCVYATFVSKMGCPNSFYAAINWLNTSKAVVSYDNATLPSLLALQEASLRFDDIQENGASAQMAEISCR